MTKQQEVKLFLAGMFAMIDTEAKKNPLYPSVDEILQGVSPVEYALKKLNEKEEKKNV